jgi:uncharacterized protein
MPNHTNRLINESSPYLLQHAHNPVDWYPWGEEAFNRAKAENKPVLVSIGYAACHWCHVMERESFENEQVAAIMNNHFINIKVDREERPDVDHIYMDAVQAITGSGGWPLNVFLTADRKPFYGGTYFPPSRAFNRPSWTEVLLSLSETYQTKKNDIEQQADLLTNHLVAANSFGTGTNSEAFDNQQVQSAFGEIMKNADKEWGGFGRAPKFPQSFIINFLLSYSYYNTNEEALQQAILSLDKMAEGGIYDHIGGGFARYSTDTEWLAPHFEKMLYDNALLLQSYSEAYRLTQKEEYREIIEQTIAFLQRELMDPSGGFYSALDADSEGVEGKFYVWTYEEVKEVVGKEADLFCRYYDISAKGNWEGRNIPRIKNPVEKFVQEEGIDRATLKEVLAKGRERLLERRSQRIRPALDDKVLLSWNALMNIGLSNAYAATGNEEYKDLAVRNMEFMLNNFGKDELFHSWKEGIAKHPAFLDDYSHLVAALIHLSEITADYRYLNYAAAFTEKVLADFSDTESPLLFFTGKNQKDVLIRKKEIYDGATPSGNSVMASNLYHLGILLDKGVWKEKAEAMLAAVSEISVKYPTSFGNWLKIIYQLITGISEIALTGPQWKELLKQLLFLYVPHRLMMASEIPLKEYPLLAEKPMDGENHIYLCRNYVCQRPVSTVEEFVKLL